MSNFRLKLQLINSRDRLETLRATTARLFAANAETSALSPEEVAGIQKADAVWAKQLDGLDLMLGIINRVGEKAPINISQAKIDEDNTNIGLAETRIHNLAEFCGVSFKDEFLE